MKSRLLLEGSFFPGGNRDLDYFFYDYRVNECRRLHAAGLRGGAEGQAEDCVLGGRLQEPGAERALHRPGLAALLPWVQYLMPMDYRSHYGGDFETHLDLLAESIQQQKIWARDFEHFWPGVAASQLYEEEREPLTRMRRLLRDGGQDVAGIRAAFAVVEPRLKAFAPDLHGAIEAYLAEPKEAERVAAKLDAFVASVPEGYYSPERLTKTLERVRAQDVEGVVIFSTGGISSLRLWEAVGEFFGK